MADPYAHLDLHAPEHLADLERLLRIPSISTDPAHDADTRAAAEWVAERMRAAGLDGVRLLETTGHPAVFGQWLDAPGRPTVLFYGHYDVQPPDPLAEWTTPPFQPTLRDGRLYARGADDMKGNLLLPILACEAWLRETGEVPVNVKVLLEGEEEIGSPHFGDVLGAHRDLLACDHAICADGSQLAEDMPTVGVGTRGIVSAEIHVRTADTDLHSGLAGGLAPNPIHVLANLLATMISADGRITVEGFCDEVAPPTEAERAAIAAVPDESGLLAERAGLRGLVGEPGYSPQERNVARPTLEVNGIWGGYQGAGTKTVIPAEAHAKVTCRLVPDQTPAAVAEHLRAHVARHAPAFARAEVVALPGSSDPFLVPEEEPALRAAKRVFRSLYGRAPYRTRSGGSVGALPLLREALGVSAVTMGFGVAAGGAHAPNEYLPLALWERGKRAYAMLLAEFSG